MKYILLITLTLFAACTVHRNGFKKSETIRFSSVKMITYLQKSDTIFLTRDSTTIRNVIDFVNLSKPAEQSVYFKSYRFLILEFDDQSHIRIETSKTYFRRNGEIYNSTINIDSILAENITDKSL